MDYHQLLAKLKIHNGDNGERYFLLFNIIRILKQKVMCLFLVFILIGLLVQMVIDGGNVLCECFHIENYFKQK